MKKLFFAFSLFVVSLAFGQMETVKFDRKLVYEQDTASSKESKRSIREVGGVLEYYHSSSYGMLRIKPKMEDYIGSYYMLFGKKFPFWATIDAVDRTIAMSPLSIEDVSIKVDFTKTNKKGKVGGVSCNYYEGALVEKGKVVMEVCVDETSSYDNFSKVFSGNTKKGLMLSVSIKEKGDKVTFNLAKNEPLNLSMTLDTKQIEKGFVEREKKAAAIETAEAVAAGEEHDCSGIDVAEEDYISDPLLNVYSTNAYKNNGLDNVALFYQIVGFIADEEDYTSGEGRKKTIALLKLNYKSVLKNYLKTKHISKEEYKKMMKFFQEYVKEVEAFNPKKSPKREDAVKVRGCEVDVTDVAEDTEYPKYNSAYKTMHMEKKPSLALDDALKSENLKQAIPQFCSDIYGQVSVFENEELQKQLLHFMGQTCDLYLYPKVDNVYYDGTLDALRRSVLEIEKLRPSLSKKDLKNLRTLIENLD